VTERPPRFAFVGYGTLASALAAALRRAGAEHIGVYVRARPSGDPSSRDAELLAAGMTPAASVADAVAAADVAVAAVPAAASRSIAEAALQSMRAGALYVDPTPLPPREKEALAERFAGAGVSYVDAAVLGTVLTEGGQVPILVSGEGALRFTELAVRFGLRVSTIDGPAGRASTVKLVRSVFMKGRDALILEMVLAARRQGLGDIVVASIGGKGEDVPFSELVRRVLCSLAVHAERRVGELESSAAVLAASGVEPVMTRAAAERLRRMADLDLRPRFAGDVPKDVDDVLAALDELG
jgi:3-hydroxyisobutyrate dehydrogenase-like beta-hydroxyacid dehydrogenase